MRISTTMQYQNALAYIQNANSAVDEAASQYSTGKLFETASEDPAGMSAKIKYDSAIASYAQYTRNAGFAYDDLTEEETALEAMWTTLSSVNTSLIQAVDGTNDSESLDAIAEYLESLRDQLFDLMNTQNTEGEYIFSGSQSSVPTMTLTSDGTYTCQADGSTRSVQISPSITVQTSDSGLNIFENCSLANTLSYEDGVTLDGQTLTEDEVDDLIYVMVADYDEYDSLYDSYYDYTTSGEGTNYFTITVNTDGTFTVYDRDGEELASGDVELNDDGSGTIETMGVSVSLFADYYNSGEPESEMEITVTLDKPSKGNILNVLTDVIDALRNEDLTSEELSDILAQAEVSVQNAMDQYDTYRGRVGARLSNIESVIESNEALEDIKTEALASITEIDTYEAVTNLVMAQMSLEVAEQVFSVVQGTSLFDYI